NAIIETATNTLIAGCQSTIIPHSVTSIGESAFEECSGLTSVTIPNSVTSIGDSAFSRCSGLTSMVVESGNLKYDSRDNSNAIIETATNTLIAGCQSTIIPHSVTSIGYKAFYGCSGLTSITIPNSVTSIGDSAFSGCSGLTSVTIPNSVTSIGDWAFDGCSGLTSVTIPNSVTSIGDFAFHGCSSLTSVVWNAKNCADFKYSNYAPFYDIAAQITSFTFGEEVEHIPASLCNKMANLTSITIPNSVKSIGEYVFGGCSGLTKTNYMGDIQGWCGIKFGNVYSNPLFYSNKLYTNDEVKDLVIPDGITSIGAWSFENCSGLTSITLPSSVTSIGEKAFEECNALETIFVPAGQKARFVAMGLPAAKIVERDNEKLKQLLTLAQVYEAGVIEPKDMAKAVRYYEGAIEEGSAEAAYHLGELYRNGKEVAADLQLAVNYFGKAAEKHYKDAAQQLAACREALERYNRQMEQFMHTERPQNEPYYLFFDTETNGLPSNYQAPISATDNWPRLIQIGWIVTDAEGNELQVGNYLVYPDGFTIPSDVERLTGISYSRARSEGKDLKQVLTAFMQQFNAVKHIVGHNIDFDLHIVGAELYRKNLPVNTILSKPYTCTMRSTIDFCKLPPFTYGSWKFPKLQELYHKLFGTQFAQAHDAMNDIRATKQCFFELQKRGII
ncbi:MAG: leucine-rich repeat protein, partial [Paludibacteraceae bacterium]